MPVTDDAGLGEILRAARTIAVVGLSDHPARPSHSVALYLKANGFTIVPVNPNLTQTLGERAVGSLADIEGHIDIVDVFRRPEHVPALTREAVSIGTGTFWLQLGIVNDEAMRIAEAGGLYAVQDRCLRVEYQRLIARGHRSGPSGRP